jgi:hypothetical protein
LVGELIGKVKQKQKKQKSYFRNQGHNGDDVMVLYSSMPVTAHSGMEHRGNRQQPQSWYVIFFFFFSSLDFLDAMCATRQTGYFVSVGKLKN